MKERWVRSYSGLQHLTKGRVYLCNQALLHTKNYVNINRKYLICANCLERMGKSRRYIIAERKARRRRNRD